MLLPTAAPLRRQASIRQRGDGSARCAQHPGGQHDDGAQQREQPVHRDSQQPKRQQQQPHERIEQECRYRERPAEEQQEEPEQECHHRAFPLESVATMLPDLSRGYAPSSRARNGPARTGQRMSVTTTSWKARCWIHRKPSSSCASHANSSVTFVTDARTLTGVLRTLKL